MFGGDGEVSAGDGAVGVTRWERHPFIGESVRSGREATLQRKGYNEPLMSQEGSFNGNTMSCTHRSERT